MTIAAYVRVSTKGQKHDAQEAEIGKWLEGNGVDAGQVEWYRDKETGKTLDRPDFNRLQADIFAGQVKTVVVWRLDRLARRLREGVNLLADWCDRGLKIVVVTQQIEMTGPIGRLLAAVMLGLAEIELQAIKERQAAGIERAKAKGVYKGRKAGTTKAKPERARQLRQQGLKVPEIAQALGVTVVTVYRYLR